MKHLNTKTLLTLTEQTPKQHTLSHKHITKKIHAQQHRAGYFARYI